jgi:endonuclease/exonuclease/phosphatase family metal-dependent hydrolase
VQIRALTWNLFHGRDFPPDPRLRTWSSQLLRRTTRNDTHVQVNRELLPEFTQVLAAGNWDVALLQECPPRWTNDLADGCDADSHRVLTSRNHLLALRSLAARHNPDLIASAEGGSNLTLVRPSAGAITGRREFVLRRGPRPERRAMALTRLANGLSVANLHASTDDPLAVAELRIAARAASDFAGDGPLILGGDLNVRPRDDGIFDELATDHALAAPTAPDAIDHLLVRDLDVLEPPRAWPPDERELVENGLRLRLSDHAPVEALFCLREEGATGPPSPPA